MPTNGISIVGIQSTCTPGGSKTSFKLFNNSIILVGEIREAFCTVTNFDNQELKTYRTTETTETFSVYDLPNGTYKLHATNQNGDSADDTFQVNCFAVCDLGAGDLQVISNKSSSNPITTDGSVEFNKPGTQARQYMVLSAAGPTPWQSSPIFTGLLAGEYQGSCCQVNNTECVTSVFFTIKTVYVVNSELSVTASNMQPVTNNTLDNGYVEIKINKTLPDRVYQLTVTRRDTKQVALDKSLSGADSANVQTLYTLNPALYDVVVVEDDGYGSQKTVSTSFTIAKRVLGCTNRKARNYNPVANIDDNSCDLPTGNTGYQAFLLLEEYYTDDNSLTGNTKPNSVHDPDYAPPIVNITACPL
jgi:hypothetical protein